MKTIARFAATAATSLVIAVTGMGSMASAHSMDSGNDYERHESSSWQDNKDNDWDKHDKDQWRDKQWGDRWGNKWDDQNCRDQWGWKMEDRSDNCRPQWWCEHGRDQHNDY